MSTKRVMEDLDALLADLQSTTSHIQNYQQRQDADSRDSSPPPPPVPPHPSQDIMNSLHDDQPVYEPQVIKHVQVNRAVYTAPNTQHRNGTTQPPPPPPGGQQPKHMSTLSSNLSELDSLLQDLSSAQFMAEVDRRNAANLQSPSTVPPQPVISTKPASDGRTVDSLLTELENFLPPSARPVPPPMQHSPITQPEVNHYEHVTPRQMPPTQRTPASTATRELDDLMNSLSEFKQVGGNAPPQMGEPPYAQPQKLSTRQTTQASHGVISTQGQQGGGGQGETGNLDVMLGNLESDMSKQGVTTVPKGHCAACTKPIIGQVITALGHMWHPEHFTCAHCKEELGTQNFFERDGQPYCELDYHTLFSPRCAECGGPILDKCVTAMDMTFHPEHFVCSQCGRPFGEGGFHQKDGRAYCRSDYFELFAPKCGSCTRPIMDNYISALNKQWHPECFICNECHVGFGGGSFFDHEGMPYCETHYHAKRGSLCAGCHKPITGRCITAMYKKFHPEHFVCAFCLKQLNKGTFKEQNEKPYCHQCFVKLFG